MSEEITFGGWLKQRRKELGITQEELADHIGCSLSALQKIEGGERRPSGQVVHLLADFFSILRDERAAFTVFARTGRTGPAASTTPSGGKTLDAPWRAISLRHTNLPVVLSDLIGREQEEETTRNFLLNAKVRLLSLSGPPGVGKTRLALQVASDLAGNFEDGVTFVDLAAIENPAMVIPTVAHTLGLKTAGDVPVEIMLLNFVRERRMLLVLDNFEQVLDAASEVVKLMEASPWLKVLITSREALHVRGERRFSVPPLKVPDPSTYIQRGSLAGEPPSLEALATYPSIELFIERAQAVSPEFELTKEIAVDVAAICAALEGLPLAIELTAARAGHFSPREMRAALGNIHAAGYPAARDAPARQRSLKNAFGWSYGLLDPTEQKLFKRLSVFVHGCSLAAAESVCNTAGDLGTSISEALTSLVEKSLIIRLYEGGVSRYMMLETIREYAHNELEADQEGQHTKRQHAYYYSVLVHEAESHLAGPDQSEWLDNLATDHDNIRTALGWLLRNGTSEEALVRMALQIAADMGRFWYLRGYYEEGREWLNTTLRNVQSRLALADEGPVDRGLVALYVRGLDIAGWLALTQGDHPTARKLWESGLDLDQAWGNNRRSGHLLNGLAQIALDRLSYEEAISLFQKGLNLAREGDDKLLIARILNNLANVYRNMMDYVAARQCYEDSLLLLRTLGDKTNMVGPLNNLGLVSMDLEDYIAARSYLEESLHLCRELDQKQALAFALAFMGQLEARELDFDKASRAYNEALSLAHDLGSKVVLANCFEWVASVQTKLGHSLEAGWLWGQAAALREAMDLPLPLPGRVRYERDIASASAQLGLSSFEATWAEGKAATIEEAVKYAQVVLRLRSC
ncbi:MAG TPA: tetratricopeptide repeat protein [Chloroflexia bacterium]|nr:tetratricopeptide repeat protein [Chloroflexia bacterium]